MRQELLRIYGETLALCAPEAIVRAMDVSHLRERVDVVAMGKCAAGLFDGVVDRIDIGRAFVAIPSGYPRPHGHVAVVEGGHPRMNAASFAAGARCVEFVRSSRRRILFLISGGASASLELPLQPWFNEDDVARANDLLVRSGLPIETMNVVRRHLSAIKGGRLATLARSGGESWIYSDVSRGHEEHVASGPTLPDLSTNDDAARVIEPFDGAIGERLRRPDLPETPKDIASSSHRVIADNSTLVRAAAKLSGFEAVEQEMNGDVDGVARALHERIRSSRAFVAGGEPTVVVRGSGRGGRCSEVAVRFARLCAREGPRDVHAVIGSSDGLDGNSGCAGYAISIGASTNIGEDQYRLAIDRSDTGALAASLGAPIPSAPTGNNLRDIFIVARASQVPD